MLTECKSSVFSDRVCHVVVALLWLPVSSADIKAFILYYTQIVVTDSEERSHNEGGINVYAH